MDNKDLMNLINIRSLALEVVSDNNHTLDAILEVGYLIRSRLIMGDKLLVFGNGGSAAQAQHFVAELVCRYRRDRNPLPAVSLNSDVSIITAWSNDKSFSHIFSRQIKGLGKRNDIAFALTTSDSNPSDSADFHSENITFGLMEARERGMTTVGLVSKKTKNLLQYIDHPIVAPSTDTPIVQEIHQMFIHLLCEIIEE